MSFSVERYNGNESEWDQFVLEKSMNGTFIQTRKFINYHPANRFEDCSLCVRKGKELVAVVLGCCIDDDGKVFFAHKGTTFGGITISSKIYSASNIEELFNSIEDYLIEEGYQKIYFKMVPGVYQKNNVDLLDYFFYNHQYNCFNELNYYITLDKYKDDVIANFSYSKRRDYRYSLKNNLVFKELGTKDEIEEFYSVLLLNLEKLGLKAVHTLDELFDLKFNRFVDNIEFYGVYYKSRMIAGSMIFIFNNNIFHTQYLSSNEQYLKMYPMDFLITNLIQVAVERNMDKLTFGICTEDQGRYLNFGLSRFKEGFGTEYCINRSYEKILL